MRQGGRGEEPHEGNARTPFHTLKYSDYHKFQTFKTAAIQYILVHSNCRSNPAQTSTQLGEPLPPMTKPTFPARVPWSLALRTCCLLLALFAVSACYRNETLEHVFSVPALSSETCSTLVLQAVGSQDGVLSASPDLMNQTLHVTFNSRLVALKNIEYAIKDAGFDVDQSEGRPAAKARLPENCR